MIKKISIAFALLLTVGCSTQPSTYTDKSTPDQRNIEATGAAATEAARSNSSRNTDTNINSNVPLVRGMQVSYNGSDKDYSALPGVCCAYYPDGSRNYRREHEIYIEKEYSRMQSGKRQGRTDRNRQYASDQWKRKFDIKMQRKIDAEIDRVLKKIF